MEDFETITKEEISVETDKAKVVILHNDDFNTFNHVCSCLINICKHDYKTAWGLTIQVHEKGKAIASEGDDTHLKKIKLMLRSKGLSVTIENA